MRDYGFFAKDFIIYHVSNEYKANNEWQARHRRDIGIISGVADYTIEYYPGRVAHIELKREKTGRLSPAQKEFRDRCTQLGIPYLCTYDIQTAIDFIHKLLVDTV